jgi:hypothetical protein
MVAGPHLRRTHILALLPEHIRADIMQPDGRQGSLIQVNIWRQILPTCSKIVKLASVHYKLQFAGWTGSLLSYLFSFHVPSISSMWITVEPHEICTPLARACFIIMASLCSDAHQSTSSQRHWELSPSICSTTYKAPFTCGRCHQSWDWILICFPYFFLINA